VKIALTKARWNPCCVKESGTTIRAPAIAYRRSLTGFDSSAGTIAELTDDVIRRSLTRIVQRLWNLVKSIDHPETSIESECEGADAKLSIM
jgi:hypothetical protein